MKDVIVIGAGVMGCSIAYRLAKQEKLSVLVLEKSLPGVEASSAAAGMLGAQMEAHTSGTFLEFCLHSRDLYKSFAEELFAETEIHIGYRERGILEIACEEADAERLIGRYEWQKERKLEIEMLDPKELLELEPLITQKNHGALLYPKDHQVDPKALANAVSCAAYRSGAEFLSGKTVEKLVIENNKVKGVLVEGELLTAHNIIVAAGAWTSQILGLPTLRCPIRPIRGQMLVLDSRPPKIQHSMVSSRGYMVPRADGRVLVGSTMESAGFQKKVTLGGLFHLSSLAQELVPALKDSALLETWSGFRPAPDDGIPLIGRTTTDGLWIVSGHHRNGILLLPGTIELLITLFRGEKPDFDASLFKP